MIVLDRIPQGLDSTVNRIVAAFACLVIGFTGVSARDSRHAQSDQAGAVVPSSATETASSPESCLTRMDQLSEKVWRKAQKSGREVDAKVLRRPRSKIAEKCVASFSIYSVSPEHLPALSKLYFEAEQLVQADMAITSYLKSPQATNASRSEILRTAIDCALYIPVAAEQSALAEKYLAQLDELGAPVIRERVRAHLRLAQHYLSRRDDAKALHHEQEILLLVKTLPADQQKAALDEAIEGLDTQALFLCSSAGAARSREIIAQIPTELIRIAHAEEWISAVSSRYLMDGQEAPQLFPRKILNAASGEDVTRAHKGQVTVMLFAAYWCGPCHAIYPHVIETYRKFKDDGVRVLLVTQLSNPADDAKAPKPEEELAAIQKSYLEDVKMPFPIVIEGPLAGKSGDKSIDPETRNRQWRLFSFYPMILVVDKKGRTRAILIGTVPGQRERLKAKVEELLKEPA